ncbi:acyl-CoA reductase [Vicingaceae bacterium]|nr:acyl-CoA reductase [Vicingaceae bacterium]MDC1452130.1 acyl-CoA reductase [Vicingaceae bacterium]
MNSETKKSTLIALGEFFNDTLLYYKDNDHIPKNKELKNEIAIAAELVEVVHSENGWFTKDSVMAVYQAWANALEHDKVERWLSHYDLESNKNTKVGVIMAGNLPLVGLHDALSVIISGNVLHAKVSSKDRSLMMFVLKVIQKLIPNPEQVQLVERLNDVDCLIATGSDNSARYFDYYFKDKKRIIRKNRTSIAVLIGDESEEELNGLSHDIFRHFGLGCRNVTKLYLPQGYNLDDVFKALFHYQEIANHNKYANNYDYNKAVYLLNKIELIENGFLLMKEDEGIHSPVGVLFYEFYDTIEEVKSIIEDRKDELQCVVSNAALPQRVPFGAAQSPELWDYADGVDTIEFLLN